MMRFDLEYNTKMYNIPIVNSPTSSFVKISAQIRFVASSSR